MAETIKKQEDKKDVLEAIKKIKRIQEQRKTPDRNGMISALQDARDKAPLEITVLEFAQGDTRWMPFTEFPDTELYRKLAQYQQGLENYCIQKIGKKAFDELMKK